MIISVFFTVKIPKLLKKAKDIDVQIELSKEELCRRNTDIVRAFFRSTDEVERKKLKELNQEPLNQIL